MAAEKAEYLEQIFLNESQALKLVFKDLDIAKREIVLSAHQHQRIQKRLRRKIKDTHYTLYTGSRHGRVERYAMIGDEEGKHFPITFIVAMSAQAQVEQVAVMVYRERRGDGVKRQRFLSQFVGKKSQHPIAINQDIVHIAGSTISSWSIAAGVRKAVVLLEEAVLKP